MTDFRAVNSVLEWAGHWVAWMPTLEDMRVSIPRSARWFFPEDIKDAFEHVVVHPGDREKLTVAPPVRLKPSDFTVKELKGWGYTEAEIQELMGCDEILLQWQHAPQGLAPIAPFWNVYMAHGLSACFDEDWHRWMALFVDDVLGHGVTEAQAKLRQRMIGTALRLLGKRLSEKLDRTVKQIGDIAGLRFTPDGVVIGDEAVDALVQAMGETITREKDARRLVGIIIYAQSSFEWDLQGQTIYAELLSVLHNAMAAPKFVWTEECKRAVVMLRERVKAAPRVACRPEELLNDGWCIVVKTDASKRGAGACMLLVNCADARQVTEETLADPSKIRLIATLSKVLSSDERKWLTFEQEAYGMYLALRKWGSFLMQVTIDHPEKWLIGLFMDSTTAVSQWMSITVPGPIDFCNAKEMRFRSWAEKVGWVRHMNMFMNWWPGGINDWSDLLSRIADKLAECAEERDRARSLMPMQRHSYHVGGESDGKAAEDGVPSGCSLEHLALDPDEWKEVEAAYLADDTRMQGVKVSDVYRMVAMGGEGVDAGIQAKVRTWVGTMVFAVTPPGSKVQMMYTTRSQLRSHNNSGKAADGTKVLVLVVPGGANVRVTSGESPEEASGAGHWSVIDLKRDLLLLCHEQQSHPRIEETIQRVKRLCWFPEMITYVKKHLDACGFCLERLKAEVVIGTGIETLERGKVVQMDHRKLTDREKEMVGEECIGILTVTDVASRKVLFEPVRSESAMGTAVVLVTDWIPENGIPEVVITDPAPGFGSEVMACIYQVLGVKKRELKEREAKGPVSVVEAKHRGLNVVLEDGFSTGAIDSFEKLRIFCKFAQTREYQTARPGHVSQFEMWCGQAPRTMESLVTAAAGEIQMPKQISTDDLKTAMIIQQQCKRLLEYEFELRDEKARANKFRRHIKEGVAPQVTRFDLRKGESVSFDGKKVVITDLVETVAGKHTAEITYEDGKTRNVQYRDLRPLAVGRPQRSLPETDVEEGDFVVGKVEGEWIGGVVSSAGAEVKYDAVEANKSGLSWLPVWEKDGDVVRKMDRPKGYDRSEGKMDVTEVKAVGSLTDTWRLTEVTRRKLENLEVI